MKEERVQVVVKRVQDVGGEESSGGGERVKRVGGEESSGGGLESQESRVENQEDSGIGDYYGLGVNPPFAPSTSFGSIVGNTFTVDGQSYTLTELYLENDGSISDVSFSITSAGGNAVNPDDIFDNYYFEMSGSTGDTIYIPSSSSTYSNGRTTIPYTFTLQQLRDLGVMDANNVLQSTFTFNVRLYTSTTLGEPHTISGTETSIDVSLVEGVHSIVAIQTDEVGNISKQSQPLIITLDSTAPVITLNGDDTITLVEGTAYTDSGATVVDPRNPDYSGTVSTSVSGPSSQTSFDSDVLGDWTFTYSAPADLAGNTPENVVRTVTVVQSFITNDDTVKAGGRTPIEIDVLSNDIIPTGGVLTVTTAPNNGAALISASGDKIIYTPNALFSGSDSFIYTYTTATKSTHTATVRVTIDRTPPTLSNPSDIGLTRDTTPDLSFTSNEDGTFALSGSCSTKAASGVTAGTPKTITLDTLTDGEYGDCAITVTDMLGNQSLPLDIPDFTIDTTPPPAPTNLDLSSDDDTGESNTDDITSKTTDLTLTIEGEDGANVQLYKQPQYLNANLSGESSEETGIGDYYGFGVSPPLKPSASFGSIVGNTFTVDGQSYTLTEFYLENDGSISDVSLSITDANDNNFNPRDIFDNYYFEIGGSTGDTIHLSSLSSTYSNGRTTIPYTFTNQQLRDLGVMDTNNVLQSTFTFNVRLYTSTTLGEPHAISGSETSIDVSLVEGVHRIVGTQTDGAGNISKQSQPITITLDSTAPVITITGDKTINLVEGTAYTDSGATVIDHGNPDYSSTVSTSISGPSSQTTFDSNVAGDWTFTYSAPADLAGNTPENVVRTVTVLLTAPTNLDLSSDDDTGESNTDDITSKTTDLTFTIEGEDGANVQLYRESQYLNAVLSGESLEVGGGEGSEVGGEGESSGGGDGSGGGGERAGVGEGVESSGSKGERAGGGGENQEGGGGESTESGEEQEG